jgi:hypothetical protein
MDSTVHNLRRVFGADLRSLALARMGLGLALLADLIERAPLLRWHYSDAGVAPRAALTKGWGDPDQWPPLYFLAGGTWWPALLFALSAALALALMAGYRTRLATAGSWLLLVSLQARNPAVLAGGDRLLALALFWGMFLPLGARWSVDRLQARRRGALEGKDSPPDFLLSVATAGFFFQIFAIYFFGTLHKSGNTWADGTAIYYALAKESETRPFGRFLFQYPALLEVMTPMIWWLEMLSGILLAAPFLFGPLRTGIVVALIGMHAGLYLSLSLSIFPLVNVVVLAGLLPSWLWDEALPALGTRLAGLARLGNKLREWALSVGESLARTLPPMGRLAALKPWPLEIVAGLFLAYVVYYNLAVYGLMVAKLPWIPAPPYALERFAGVLRLNQRWTMYSPDPSFRDGWFAMPTRLADGRVVDLLKGGAPISWEAPAREIRLPDGKLVRVFQEQAAPDWARPKPLSAGVPYVREQLYLDGLLHEKLYFWLRPEYVRGQLAQWNQSHPPQEKALAGRLYYLYFELLPGRTSHVKVALLHEATAEPEPGS